MLPKSIRQKLLICTCTLLSNIISFHLHFTLLKKFESYVQLASTNELRIWKTKLFSILGEIVARTVLFTNSHKFWRLTALLRFSEVKSNKTSPCNNEVYSIITKHTVDFNNILCSFSCWANVFSLQKVLLFKFHISERSVYELFIVFACKLQLCHSVMIKWRFLFPRFVR